MRKEEFTFDSRDGKTKLYACKWIPEKETPLCIVQIIHGMNDHINRYEAFAQYLAQRDILVVGEDHLGHGNSVVDGGVYGYVCETDAATVIVRDAHRLKKIIQEKYPQVPYIIFGHSMGSFMVRNYLAKYGNGIQGAILSSTGTPKRYELLYGKIVTTILAKIKGSTYVSKHIDSLTSKTYKSGTANGKTKYDWLTQDETIIESYKEDPFCCGYTYTVNGYHTMFELADRMQKKEALQKIPKKLPILIVSGTEDPVGNNGLAPKELYDSYLNLDLTKVTLKLYNGARHEILNEKIKETVFLDLHSWIEMVAIEALGR